MTATAVYTCAPTSNGVRRERVVHENIEVALAMAVEVEKHVLDETRQAASSLNRTMPGLVQVQTGEQIIALGRDAHTILADYPKRTLIGSTIDFDDGDDSRETVIDDINRFIWSCVNTSKVVALGNGAWRSVQMLPLADRRFYSMPPLRLAPAVDQDSPRGLLVIDHETEGDRARELAAFLEPHFDEVDYVSLGRGAGDDASWTGDAGIHVHVGHHTIATEDLRLLDSWNSRRLALQMLPRRAVQTRIAGEDALLVEDEVNGFVRYTKEAILASCEELRSDQVLRRKFIDAGVRTAAPLAQRWKTIAEDLLN